MWTNTKCKSSYGSSAPGGIQEHMLCASLPEQKKDSCSVSIASPSFNKDGRSIGSFFLLNALMITSNAGRQRWPALQVLVPVRRLHPGGHRVLGDRVRQEGVPGRLHKDHQDAAVDQEDCKEVLSSAGNIDNRSWLNFLKNLFGFFFSFFWKNTSLCTYYAISKCKTPCCT